jgi:hypothetical protein
LATCPLPSHRSAKKPLVDRDVFDLPQFGADAESVEKLDEAGEKRHPARRWVVERTLAWLSKCRAILIRYEEVRDP